MPDFPVPGLINRSRCHLHCLRASHIVSHLPLQFPRRYQKKIAPVVGKQQYCSRSPGFPNRRRPTPCSTTTISPSRYANLFTLSSEKLSWFDRPTSFCLLAHACYSLLIRIPFKWELGMMIFASRPTVMYTAGAIIV